jgi:hypothetical protein
LIIKKKTVLLQADLKRFDTQISLQKVTVSETPLFFVGKKQRETNYSLLRGSLFSGKSPVISYQLLVISCHKALIFVP